MKLFKLSWFTLIGINLGSSQVWLSWPTWGSLQEGKGVTFVLWAEDTPLFHQDWALYFCKIPPAAWTSPVPMADLRWDVKSDLFLPATLGSQEKFKTQIICSSFSEHQSKQNKPALKANNRKGCKKQVAPGLSFQVNSFPVVWFVWGSRIE